MLLPLAPFALAPLLLCEPTFGPTHVAPAKEARHTQHICSIATASDNEDVALQQSPSLAHQQSPGRQTSWMSVPLCHRPRLWHMHTHNVSGSYYAHPKPKDGPLQ